MCEKKCFFPDKFSVFSMVSVPSSLFQIFDSSKIGKSELDTDRCFESGNMNIQTQGRIQNFS